MSSDNMTITYQNSVVNRDILPTYDLQTDQPIGLFDSGVGGLSVYKHLKKVLPNERYVYYADTLNVPYGSRSKEEIIEFTFAAVEKLRRLHCKTVVIACNSASAHTLPLLREAFPDLPIIGLVPALKPAVLASSTKKVAVLATQATLDGYLLAEVIQDIAEPQQTMVYKYFKPSLVPWVEAGMPSSWNTGDELKSLLHELEAHNIDQLVLGCTHYPFFREYAESYIAEHTMNISLVDSGCAIALRVQAVLKEQNLCVSGCMKDDSKNSSENKAQLVFYTSKYTDELQKALNFLLDYQVEVKYTPLLI